MDKNISGEFRIAVVENNISGKSFFINSLADEEILPADYSQGDDLTIYIHFSSVVEEKIIYADGKKISDRTFWEIYSSSPQSTNLIEIYVPAHGGLDNICLVKTETDFDNVNILVFVAGAKRLFAKSLIQKIDAVYKLNPVLVKNSIFVCTLNCAVSENEKLNILTRAKEHLVKYYQQKDPNPFLVSKFDDSAKVALEEIKTEIFNYRRKKFLELAFKNLPEIITSLNSAESDFFIKTFQALKNRYYDPEFRLAIIGNFSCGKSTFLNALIGRELLSTSVLPTTAIPTYIRWDKESFLKKGKHDARRYYNPIVEITSGGKKYIMTKSGKKQFETDCGIKLPDDDSAMIDELTTNDSLIGKVERVELHFLEREGFDNFCLIDTPGMNPGDTEKREHIVQTQNLLREEADAAIVLYTAKDAMSRDTREFLEQNAKHLMQGAIVVLTKMDLVPPNQCEKILKNTKKLVTKQFNQKNPCVYDISAQCTIEFLTDRSQSAEDEKWAHNFSETINTIIGQLSNRRSEIISRRTADLMVQLADSISKIIDDEVGKLSVEREVLAKASFENLEREFLTLNEAYERKLNSGKKLRKDKIKTIIHKNLGEKRTKILYKISSATDSSELKRALEKAYPEILKGVDKKIMSTINTEIIPQIKSYAEEYVKEVEICLKQYERYLGVVKTNNISVQNNIASNISNTPDIVIEDSFFDNNAALFVSGIAALFVGPLALIAGRLLDKYRFRSKKEEATIEVEKSLDEYETKLIKACTDSLKLIETENLTWAKDLLQKYKTNYKETFDTKEREHKQRVSKVEKRIAQNTANREFIQNLKNGLS